MFKLKKKISMIEGLKKEKEDRNQHHIFLKKRLAVIFLF